MYLTSTQNVLGFKPRIHFSSGDNVSIVGGERTPGTHVHIKHEALVCFFGCPSLRLMFH